MIELLTDFEANGSFEKLRNNVRIYDKKEYAWYVRATDLENNTALDRVKYVDKDTYGFLFKTKLIGGEVLITKRGEIGKVYQMPFVNIPASLAPNLYLLRLNDNVSKDFIYYYFKSHIGFKSLIKINSSSTIGAIYKDDLKNTKLTLPPESEQRKIAEILSTVDDAIDKTNAIIKKTQQLKKGLMQKLFTEGIGHTRFKETKIGKIPEEWELTKLEKVAKIQGGFAFKSGDFLQSGKYQVLRIGNLYQGKLDLNGKFRAFRTPIPGDSGHEFRLNSDSDSGLIPDSFTL